MFAVHRQQLLPHLRIPPTPPCPTFLYPEFPPRSTIYAYVELSAGTGLVLAAVCGGRSHRWRLTLSLAPICYLIHQVLAEFTECNAAPGSEGHWLEHNPVNVSGVIPLSSLLTH
jgi:hypothetical protein